MINPDPNESRHEAAVMALQLLDVMDDRAIQLHREACNAVLQYGLYIGRSGLPPDVTLGQMLQVVSCTFGQGLMPHYKLVKGEDDA